MSTQTDKCENCTKPIAKTAQYRQWFHLMTGSVYCAERDVKAVPKLSRKEKREVEKSVYSGRNRTVA